MSNGFRRWLAIPIFAFLSLSAFADGPICGAHKGPALGGYDPVAYFTVGKPQQGDPEIKVEWSGATWHFANAEHRDRFLKEPVKYAPQYGGFCAYAVSKGGQASGDPERWKIVDGRLYLNNNWLAQNLWLRAIPEMVKKADDLWPELKVKIQSGTGW